MRVRFAPSPTGELHVGGARTALFNWLLARKEGGVFVLRVEDTDRERSDEAHTRAILDGLEWLGLSLDEGPFFQSQSEKRHASDARWLLDEGKAFRDFTDPKELRMHAVDLGHENTSRVARALADRMGEAESARRAEAGEPFAIRFRVPEGKTVWTDLVHGDMEFDNSDLEDLVILRSDGTPTYNMAVVSDDSAMAITHVIRGDDHLSNTPKQVLLYEALERDIPVFGHVPMILGSDGKRLSKRHAATALQAYRDAGILPEAMVNFLALLGWSPGDDREIMPLPELVEAFSMERVLRKSAVFDLDKLQWLNGRHLASKPVEELAPLVMGRLVGMGVSREEMEEREVWFQHLVELHQGRARTVGDVARMCISYVQDELHYDNLAVGAHWAKAPDLVLQQLHALRSAFEDARWEEVPLERALRGLAGELKVGSGKLIHPLRVALTGQGASPGIFEVLVLLGRERSLARIDRAIEQLRVLAGEG
ncbi:MAG TPA: glutamate--tRNA ligase [Longimicrobiales bacterium]|jgi:glutamyl-tRNA synthetase